MPAPPTTIRPQKPRRTTTGDAMTDAERQQRCRERKSAKLFRIGLDLLKAKENGDWTTVETLARALLQF